MPTADDYRYAAHRFEEIAVEIARGASTIAGPWDHVSKGGKLTEVIRSTVENTTSDLESMLNRLLAFSDECRRRARVCDDYAAELASYRSSPRRFDSFPQPPFEWVEVDGRPASDRSRLGGIW